MFNHSPYTTVVIPFVEGDESELGPIVNDSYFGKVPADRLKIGKGVIYFKADGQFRSKIGLSPNRAKDVMGSYDSQGKILTIVQFDRPQGAIDYVNSLWEIQDEPATRSQKPGNFPEVGFGNSAGRHVLKYGDGDSQIDRRIVYSPDLISR